MWPSAPNEVIPQSCQIACDCPGLYLSGTIPNLISTLAAQASRVTKVAAQQLSSTLTALRAEVAHGGAEIADGVGALLGKPVAARPRSPSPASKRDAAAPPRWCRLCSRSPTGPKTLRPGRGSTPSSPLTGSAPRERQTPPLRLPMYAWEEGVREGWATCFALD